MAREVFTFGPQGSGDFANPAVWTPSVGAPPRSGEDQDLFIAGNTLNAVGQAWLDYDVTVTGNAATIVFGAPAGQSQLLGNDSSINQRAPDATYRVASGSVNSFGDIDIGGSGAQATGRISVAPGAGFINNGPIDVDGNLLVGGGGFFTNNSTITVQHGVAEFQSIQPGNGSAAVVIGEEGTLSFSGFFTNSAISFAAEENGRLLIGSPFAANTLRTVIGFDAGDSISIPGQGVAVQFQQAPAAGGAPAGTLVVGGANGATLATIPFTGAYEPGAFKVTYDQGANRTVIETTKVSPPPPPPPPTGDLQTVTQPVLDLNEYGVRDLAGRTVNGPNDVTLRLHDVTIRDTVLQRADFLDGELVFDGTSPQGRFSPDLEAAQIARMYYTVLGRGPEFSGAHYWVHDIMEGKNFKLEDLALDFYTSREFRARYGENTGDQEFVTLLYRNILGRDPTGDPGLNFWLDALGRGVSRPEIVVGISESVEHKTIRFAAIEQNGIQFLGDPFL